MAAGYVLALIVIVIISLTFYFIPSIIAFARSVKAKWGIFILNLFLGWMLVGWVISLVWAVVGVTEYD